MKVMVMMIMMEINTMTIREVIMSKNDDEYDIINDGRE